MRNTVEANGYGFYNPTTINYINKPEKNKNNKNQHDFPSK